MIINCTKIREDLRNDAVIADITIQISGHEMYMLSQNEEYAKVFADNIRTAITLTYKEKRE